MAGTGDRRIYHAGRCAVCEGPTGGLAGGTRLPTPSEVKTPLVICSYCATYEITRFVLGFDRQQLLNWLAVARTMKRSASEEEQRRVRALRRKVEEAGAALTSFEAALRLVEVPEWVAVDGG